jgi:hypothetical protein
MPLATITQLEPFNINNSATFTFASTSVTANVSAGNIKTDNLLYANGSAWQFSNYANTNVAAYLPTYTGNITGNIVTLTGNITAINASLGNLVTANYFTGTLTTGAQPNITSLGTLTSLTSGLITATTGGIKVGNIQDPSGTNTISLSSGNITVTSNVTATYFIGNGSQLTGLPATYANSNVAAYLPTYTGNITGNIVTLTGNVTAINASLGNLVTANFFSGAGNLLSNIQGANVTGAVSSATTAGTVTTAAQPNITSLGTLSSLTVTGDSTITGNLTVTGNFEYANVTSFKVKDPIIEQGGNPNGTALASNDGYDRGQLLHYYSGAVIDAFMGWDNSNAEFAFGSNVSVSSEVVTFNTFGNVRAGYFLGNGSQLTGTVANANYAAYAGNVVTAAQPNITSVGTLASLTVTANISSGNANLGNLVTANFFSGAGNLLSNIAGGNVTGQVANALVAGTVYTNAQPNITSVGTLTSITVTGNVTAGNVKTDNLLYANGTAWSFSGSSNIATIPMAGVQVFTADGTGNTYTLTATPVNSDQISVNIDGVVQLHTSFSLSGNVVTLSGTPVSGAKVEITNIAATSAATTGKAIAMAIVFGF